MPGNFSNMMRFPSRFIPHGLLIPPPLLPWNLLWFLPFSNRYSNLHALKIAEQRWSNYDFKFLSYDEFKIFSLAFKSYQSISNLVVESNRAIEVFKPFSTSNFSARERWSAFTPRCELLWLLKTFIEKRIVDKIKISMLRSERKILDVQIIRIARHSVRYILHRALVVAKGLIRETGRTIPASFHVWYKEIGVQRKSKVLIRGGNAFQQLAIFDARCIRSQRTVQLRTLNFPTRILLVGV